MDYIFGESVEKCKLGELSGRLIAVGVVVEDYKLKFTPGSFLSLVSEHISKGECDKYRFSAINMFRNMEFFRAYTWPESIASEGWFGMKLAKPNCSTSSGLQPQDYVEFFGHSTYLILSFYQRGKCMIMYKMSNGKFSEVAYNLDGNCKETHL